MRTRSHPLVHIATIFAMLLASLAIAVPADAAPLTYTVTKTTDTADGTCNADCSLREAITAANANSGQDTVVIPAGTYGLSIVSTNEDANADGDLDITDAVIIRGAGIGATIIDGNGGATADRVFDVHNTDVSFTDLRITDGNIAGDDGGGMRTNDNVVVTLNRVRVDNNTTDGDGGGLYLDDDALATFIDSVIDTNDAGEGAGFYASNAGVVLRDTRVDNNTATSSGGGAYNSDSNVEMFGGSLSDNTSATNGGGMYVTYGNATFEDVDMDDNLAIDGGALLVDESQVTLNRVSLDGNRATSDGGTIDTDYSNVVLTDSPITNSGVTATGLIEGGALVSYESNMELIRSPISGTTNTTTSGGLEGGAVQVDEGRFHRVDSPISDTTSSGMTATSEGGALWCENSLCSESGDNSITGTTVTAGTNSVEGGAVYVYEAGYTMTGDEISDTLVTTTGTAEGGGIFVEYGGLELFDMLLDNNVLDTDGTAEGGAVYLSDSGEGMSAYNTTFTNNVAGTGGSSGYGGAVQCADDYGGCTFEDSLFEGNTATSTGGAVTWYEAGVIARRSVFRDNSVVNPDAPGDNTEGGAFGSDDYGALLIEDSLIEGNSATYEGGAIYVYDAPLIIRDSVIRDNIVDDLEDGDSGQGGAISQDTSSPIIIERSIIENNSVTVDSGAFGGGIYAEGGAISLRDTTIIGNSVTSRNDAGGDDAQGGGIWTESGSPVRAVRTLLAGNTATSLDPTGTSQGGGIYVDDTTALFENSTFSANVAGDDGGAIFNDGGGVRLTNVTLVDNEAGTGSGALDNDTGYAAVKSSAFGGNSPASCAGVDVESRGFNLADDDSCLLDLSSDDDDTDPLLGPLAFNGGHTDTHAPLSGSPLIDHGGAACTDITGGYEIVMDQRGAGRPGGAACDTGAVEDGVGVTVTATDADAAEDGPDTGEFTFARPDTDGELVVTYTVAGTATPGDDYATLSGEVTFADGAATATAIVTPEEDDATDVDETVIVTLEPGVDYTIATPSTATVTIEDAAVVVEPEPDLEPAGVFRLDGADRFATAANVVLDRYDPADVDVVYIATGRGFPDALAGGPLAISGDAPILLSEQATLPAVTASALATLGPSKVIALGGPVALSDATLAAAGAAAGAGATTERIFGADRYATAGAIAARMPASDTVFLSVGTNFPDALAGGPVTFGAPILLTQTDALPAATAAALASRAPTKIIALGGPVAISDATLAAAATAAGGATTSRLAGNDRFETAVKIAQQLSAPTTVYVAVGTNFPDALAGGPPAEAEGAPIMLVAGTTIPAATKTYLQSLTGLRRIVILGGPIAVPETIKAELQALLN